ncbi:hypothetical protein GF376_01235 [Candidatus Peregrinibacteria bacterium]|nr:hypothetical protein [Candidatus Peregrinibacteria bacterium]
MKNKTILGALAIAAVAIGGSAIMLTGSVSNDSLKASSLESSELPICKAEWGVGKPYSFGSIVSYKGYNYECTDENYNAWLCNNKYPGQASWDYYWKNKGECRVEGEAPDDGSNLSSLSVDDLTVNNSFVWSGLVKLIDKKIMDALETTPQAVTAIVDPPGDGLTRSGRLACPGGGFLSAVTFETDLDGNIKKILGGVCRQF